MINELAKLAHQNSREKGFYDEGERNIGEMLALIHSEVSEALECLRKDMYVDQGRALCFNLDHMPSDKEFKVHFKANVKDTFEDELADIVIRVLDLAAYKNVDLEAHIRHKMRYNSLRPHKHNKKF